MRNPAEPFPSTFPTRGALLILTALLCACNGGATRPPRESEVPDLEVLRAPTEFEVIHASKFWYGIDVMGYELEISANTRLGTFRTIGASITERKITLSADDMKTLNEALAKCNFFKLPKELGEEYPDVGHITISVEAGGLRKTIRVANGLLGPNLEPRQKSVLEFYGTIMSICQPPTQSSPATNNK
jgi:hypothetical protein